ncbi:hypothetical protein BCR32DRAFT_281047 [Anaeromyces robustus]|uniref:Uncharacterized protein n=1 Tax=Anaeromyces robustus TaxID=1754192 RepID=A0A1Y1X3G3_9FUNG|nr:hypothetical protein BCR32DRAFT_281047 [Anaeromyces robustus]|eukprot:ORX79854.1 hypothetical protein BCR32DRAFT_281047 [Anaeromyces robustus]
MKFFHLLFFVVIIISLQWETQHNFVNAAKTPENTYFPTNKEGYSVFYNPRTRKDDQVFYLYDKDVFSINKYPLKGCRYNPKNNAIYCEFKDNKGKSYRIKFPLIADEPYCKPTENNFIRIDSTRDELGRVPALHSLTGNEEYSRGFALSSKSCVFLAIINELYITKI